MLTDLTDDRGGYVLCSCLLLLKGFSFESEEPVEVPPFGEIIYRNERLDWVILMYLSL